MREIRDAKGTILRTAKSSGVSHASSFWKKKHVKQKLIRNELIWMIWLIQCKKFKSET